MSRLTVLMERPKRTLGALALTLAAVGVAAGTGASFSDSSANPNNTFTAGTLTIGNSANGAILSGSGLKPGGTPVTGTVDIQNTGDLPGTFTLGKSDLDQFDKGSTTEGSSTIASQLKLTVRDCGEFSGATAPTCDSGDTAIVNDQALSDVASSGIGSEAYSAGEKHRYQFTVTFPDSGNQNAFQGDKAVAEFTWSAAQQ